MIKYLLKINILILTLLGSNYKVFAQSKDASIFVEESKREAYYIYAMSESPLNKNCKFIIVSKYIYRQKYKTNATNRINDKLGLASESYPAMVQNEFLNICKQIELDERVIDGVYGARDPILRTQDMVKSYMDAVYADGYCPSSVKDNKPAINWRSTSDFSEDCRERFLREKRNEGYHIFQIDPEKNLVYDGDHVFSKYDFEKARDRTRPLSPLFITEYYPGIIKSLSDYNRSSSGSSSSSSKSTSKPSTSTNKNSSSTSSVKKETDEEFRNRMSMLLGRAQALEREGDSYYKMGTMFYKNAMDKYQEAQRIYATASVQKKIDQINSYAQLSKTFNDGMDKVSDALDDVVHSFDPKRDTERSIGFVNYNGLLGTSDQQNSFGINGAPSDFWVGITGQRLFMSLQFKLGYIQTGNIEYTIVRSRYINGAATEVQMPEKVLINESSIGLGFGAGINIPIKNFLLYGLYGYDMRGLTINSNLISTVYKKDASIMDELPLFQKRIQFGLNYQIPKTKLGIGLNYNLLSMKRSEKSKTAIKKINPTTTDISNGYYYYLENMVEAKYSFSTFGVSAFWNLY